MNKNLIHSISIAEFDQLQGNTLTLKYPEFKLKTSDEELANNCLPDGGHIHNEDWTYIILTPDKVGAENISHKDEDQLDGALYGMAYFRNVKDASVRRGAVQKAMLILARQPLFSVFEPLLKEALIQYMSGTDPYSPRTLYNALNEAEPMLLLWGKEFPLNFPARVRRDIFPGANLTQLVKRFKEQTMVIWYSLLLEQRVLFSGQPAREVCNACIAAPLLVSPLTGFTSCITPYISLSDISPIERPTFICGTTNMIFETRLDWYDMIGNITTGSCSNHTAKFQLSSSDKQFIKSVIAGINHGEQWIRVQFMNHTFGFLKALEEGRLESEQKSIFANFMNSRLYKIYLKSKAAFKEQPQTTTSRSPLECLEELKKATDAMVRTKCLFDLTGGLATADIETINTLVEKGGLEAVAKGLTESNHNIRKYSVTALAVMASSLKGQLAILSSNMLDKVVALLADPMPNVTAAAAECLSQVSSLYIGARALSQRRVLPLLAAMACKEGGDLTTKERAAETLLQIFQFMGQTQRLDTASLLNELDSPDEHLRTSLIDLLDTLEVSIPGTHAAVQVSPAMVQKIQALQAGDAETRAHATADLLAAVQDKPHMVIQLLRAGGTVLLLENERLEPPIHLLSRLSWNVLSVCADTHAGRVDINRLRVVERAISALATPIPVYTYSVARFLEVCCQHQVTAILVARGGHGTRALMEFFLKNYKVGLVPLCVLALRALRQLLRCVPADLRADALSDMEPLRKAVGAAVDDPVSAERTVSTLVHTHVLSPMKADFLKQEVTSLLRAAEVLVDGPVITVDAAFYDSLSWTNNPLYK